VTTFSGASPSIGGSRSDDSQTRTESDERLWPDSGVADRHVDGEVKLPHSEGFHSHSEPPYPRFVTRHYDSPAGSVSPLRSKSTGRQRLRLVRTGALVYRIRNGPLRGHLAQSSSGVPPRVETAQTGLTSSIEGSHRELDLDFEDRAVSKRSPTTSYRYRPRVFQALKYSVGNYPNARSVFERRTWTTKRQIRTD
jgi:hypothetical protein